jgi:acetoacetyl-CoA synthetase
MRFVREETGNADLNSYAVLYRFSVDQPARFWTLFWDFVGIRGSGEREPVLDPGEQLAEARWFPGVSLNFAQNLLRFDDDRVAIRWHGAGEDRDTLTYAQLQRRVAALAAALRAEGVEAGDPVVSRLPHVPDALVAMLACASLGAIWFACPPGLSAAAEASVLAHVGEARVLAADEDIDTLVAAHAEAPHDFAALPFEHPLYLTVAGERGAPELLVHGAGGTLIQHLKELVLHVDLRREDKLHFQASGDSLAWYWLASALATGCTLVLNAAAEPAPDGATLWDLVDEAGISVLGVHGDWINAAAASEVAPRQSHRLLSLKTLLVAGTPPSPAAYDFAYERVKERLLLAPVLIGADTLACFALGAPVLPVLRGEVQCRALGMRVEVLDADGAPVVGEPGELACSAPFPSLPLGFADDADGARYLARYFSRHPGRWSRGERATLTARESLIPG